MIRVGILGSGYIAETHAKSVESLQIAKLVGVAGGRSAETFARNHFTKVYHSVPDLIQDQSIDAVVVCTPHGCHYEHAIMAANNKKHVYLEKPMATSVRECEGIIRACKVNNVILMIGQSQRYFPTNRAVYDILRQKELGSPLIVRSAQLGAGLDLREISLNHWALNPKLGGIGTTLGYGIHNIDKILWWLQDDPQKIYGSFRSDWGTSGKENSSFINFNTERGTDVNAWFQGSFSGENFDYQRDCAEIICEKGHIECQTYRGVRICKSKSSWKNVTLLDFKEKRPEIYRAIMDDFVTSIRDQVLPSISGLDGLRAVKLIEMAYASSQLKKVNTWNLKT